MTEPMKDNVGASDGENYEQPELRKATFLETMLLVVLAQQDCLCARLRVEPDELQEAVRTKFAQAGVALPAGLVLPGA